MIINLRRWRKVLLALILLVLLGNLPGLVRVFYPFPYRREVASLARSYNLDEHLLAAVIYVESKFNPRARSHRGAVGLMQLMPETAAWAAASLGKEFRPEYLLDPRYNLELGAWYLRNLMQEFDGEATLALAAYNGGRGNVRQWLDQGIWNGRRDNLHQIPFDETEKFVQRTLKTSYIYSKLYP